VYKSGEKEIDINKVKIEIPQDEVGKSEPQQEQDDLMKQLQTK
jgi:hypothetical protein